jgi:hypothetical protein
MHACRKYILLSVFPKRGDYDGFERTYNTGATEYYHTSTYGTWASTLTWSTNANQLFNAYVRVTAN